MSKKDRGTARLARFALVRTLQRAALSTGRAVRTGTADSGLLRQLLRGSFDVPLVRLTPHLIVSLYSICLQSSTVLFLFKVIPSKVAERFQTQHALDKKYLKVNQRSSLESADLSSVLQSNLGYLAISGCVSRNRREFGRSYGSVLHALVPGRTSDANVDKNGRSDMRSYGSVLHALVPGRMSVMSGFLRDVFVLRKIIPAAGLKHKRRILISLLALVLPAVSIAAQLINPAPASAAINEQLNFQARLLNDAGGLVPDGNYHVRFRIYEGGDGNLGGGDETLVWTEAHTTGNLVRVANGYLTVQLGSINATLDSAVDWGNDTLWLSIEIGGNGGSATWDGEMDPMMRLTSTPYAFNANNLDGRDSSEFVQLDPGGTPQSVSTANTAISVNQTGAGNVLQLQSGGSDAFTINNSGNAAFNNDVTIGDASTDRLTVTSEILGTNALVFQGATDDSFTTTLSIEDPTADTTYVLPAHSLGGTYEICTTDGNCSDSGITLQAAYNNSSFAIITLDNTRGAFRVRDNATPLGSELFAVQSNDGTTSYLSVDASGVSVDGNLDVAGDLTVQNTADSTTAYQFLDADGGAPVLNIDTTNERAGIGLADPSTPLQVGGNITVGDAGVGDGSIVFERAANANTVTLQIADQTVGSATVTIPDLAGASDTLCLETLNNCASNITLQSAYDAGNDITATDARSLVFNLADTTTDASFVVDIQGTGNQFAIQDSGTDVFTVSDGGSVLIQTTTDSTTAVQVLDTDGGTPVFNVDTTNERVGIGTDTPGEALDVAGSIQLSGADGNGLTTVFDQLTFTADSNNDGTADLFRFRGNGVTDYLVITNTGGVNLGTYDCSGNANGGVLTVDASGNVVCDDDDDSANTITLQNAYDATAGATPEIVLDTTRGAFTIRDNATPIGANLLEIQDNAGTTTYLAVDTSGATIDGTLLVTGQTDVQGNLNADGNVALGDAAADALTVNATLQGGSALTFEGVTADTFETSLAIADPTADRTITLPDESGTVCLQNSSNCGFVATADITLQNAYDTGNTLATTDNRDIVFTLSDTTTDSDFIVNLQGMDNQIRFQDGGTDVFSLSDGGQAVFQNSSNSATAFQIQNAGGTSVFTADTTNNRIYIGNPTADSTGTILVFDSKNTTGDPTGVNGAIYYNSNSNKFRCHENGVWGDCGTLPKTAAFNDDTDDTLSDSNTDLWDQATYANVQIDNSNNAVMISVVIYGNASGNDSEYNVYTIHRAVGTDPTCTSTQVGSPFTSFTNNSSAPFGTSVTFRDGLGGSTGNIRYTVCSNTGSFSSNSSVDNVVDVITITLQEIGT